MVPNIYKLVSISSDSPTAWPVFSASAIMTKRGIAYKGRKAWYRIWTRSKVKECGSNPADGHFYSIPQKQVRTWSRGQAPYIRSTYMGSSSGHSAWNVCLRRAYTGFSGGSWFSYQASRPKIKLPNWKSNNDFWLIRQLCDQLPFASRLDSGFRKGWNDRLKRVVPVCSTRENIITLS